MSAHLALEPCETVGREPIRPAMLRSTVAVLPAPTPRCAWLAHPTALGNGGQERAQVHRAPDEVREHFVQWITAVRNWQVLGIEAVPFQAAAGTDPKPPVAATPPILAQQGQPQAPAGAGANDFKWSAHKLQWTDFARIENEPGNPRIATTVTITDASVPGFKFNDQMTTGEKIDDLLAKRG